MFSTTWSLMQGLTIKQLMIWTTDDHPTTQGALFFEAIAKYFRPDQTHAARVLNSIKN